MGKGSGCGSRPPLRIGDTSEAVEASYAPVSLSDVERAQLGSLRTRRNGEPSAHPYPDEDRWRRIRETLVERSRRSNPRLDDRLTAYTPGETLELLDHPVVAGWHRRCVARVPERYTTLVLVPCAKTKPWTGPAVSKSRLYSAYNQLREEMPDVCFATVSEPLGIVPMQDWADFPQYDNPGLFRDDAQQSGMTKQQWEASEFGRWYGLPFDEAAWRGCIDRLGAVVGDFLDVHSDRRILSFVDSASGPQSTHGAMLDVAIARSGVAVTRAPKRLAPRTSPLEHLRARISDPSPQ